MSNTSPSIAKNKIQRSLLQVIYSYPNNTEKQKVWQYFENRCAYCDCEIEQSSRKGHLDHLIAISNGGTNNIHNFVLACNSCNGDEKREKNWQDFLLIKCRELPTQVFEQRLNKIKNWQKQAKIIRLSPDIQAEIEQIIEQAKKDYDNAIQQMRNLRNKIKEN